MPSYSTPLSLATWQLLEAGRELLRRNHTVLVETAAGLSIRPALAKRELVEFEWLSNRTVRLYGKPRLVVSWFAYFVDRGTRRSPLVEDALGDPMAAKLVYENGMTRGAVTLDPNGFLADSYYVGSLNARVQQEFDEEACDAHIANHLTHDVSKRPQPKEVDIPHAILSRYVFIPTRKPPCAPNLLSTVFSVVLSIAPYTLWGWGWVELTGPASSHIVYVSPTRALILSVCDFPTLNASGRTLSVPTSRILRLFPHLRPPRLSAASNVPT